MFANSDFLTTMALLFVTRAQSFDDDKVCFLPVEVLGTIVVKVRIFSIRGIRISDAFRYLLASER